MFVRILAVTIGILMHFSLCTGGSFAVLSAGVNAFAARQSHQRVASGPMSYGSIGYLSCAASKRAANHLASAHAPGCTDANACLTREFARKRDLLVVSILALPAVLPVAGSIDIDLVPYSISYSPPPKTIIALAYPGISSIVKVE